MTFTDIPFIAVFLFIIDLIVRIFLLIYIPKNRKPTAATAWLLLIFIMPIFGTVLFAVLGSTQLSRIRRRKQLEITKAYKKLSVSLPSASDIPPVYQPMAALATSLTKLPATSLNTIKVLTDYDNAINDMAAKIAQAKRYVYVEFYAMTLDSTTEPFFQAMEKAVKNGADVYVLFDTFGSKKYKGYKPMQSRLTSAGIRWAIMLPTRLPLRGYTRPDLRNHRKIVAIDNKFAYIGSLNMIDKTYHRKDTISYIELVVRTMGPSVQQLAAVFAGDWYSETNEKIRHFTTELPNVNKGSLNVQVIPSGSAYPHPNNLYFMTMLVHSARTSIHITNPYLVPDASLLSALIAAAQRGVHVSILNSEVMDQWMVGNAQRSYYNELLAAGVHISLYHQPQLVHEKFMVIDQSMVIIGSSNLDIRSFELNMECMLAVYDASLAKKLARHHTQLLQNSQQLPTRNWRARSLRRAILESLSRLASALQ